MSLPSNLTSILTDHSEPFAGAWRKELRWPCRFMTDAQLQTVMNQVISAHMGELLIRGFTEAFGER
jgi:hypothetical protein